MKTKRSKKVRKTSSNEIAESITLGFRSQDLTSWEIFTHTVFFNVYYSGYQSIDYRNLHYGIYPIYFKNQKTGIPLRPSG